MKKFTILALTALMIVGCTDEQTAREFEREGFVTLTTDSCEYIMKSQGYKGFLAHKGNCRFCKERRQKELEELAIKLKEK